MTKQAACKQAMVKLAQVRLAINYVLRSRAMEKAAAPQWHPGGMSTAHADPNGGYEGQGWGYPAPQTSTQPMNSAPRSVQPMGSIADLKKSMRNFGITATRRNKQWVNSGDPTADAQTAKEQLDMFKQWRNSLSAADQKRWASVLDKNEARLSDYGNTSRMDEQARYNYAARKPVAGAPLPPVTQWTPPPKNQSSAPPQPQQPAPVRQPAPAQQSGFQPTPDDWANYNNLNHRFNESQRNGGATEWNDEYQRALDHYNDQFRSIGY